MSDYEKVRALFPSPLTCNTWFTLQNGFEGLVTSRGACRLRKPVLIGGCPRWDIYRVTPKGGMVFDCSVSRDV